MVLAISKVVASSLSVCKPSSGGAFSCDVNNPLWNQTFDVDASQNYQVCNVVALGIFVRLSNNAHNVAFSPDPSLALWHPLILDRLHVCAHHVLLWEIMPQLHFHQEVSVSCRCQRWCPERIISLTIVHVARLIHDSKVIENRFPLLSNVHVKYHIAQVIHVNLESCASFQHHYRKSLWSSRVLLEIIPHHLLEPNIGITAVIDV